MSCHVSSFHVISFHVIIIIIVIIIIVIIIIITTCRVELHYSLKPPSLSISAGACHSHGQLP
jgi:uncharacterized integral membrane protein